jgi:hypothetical protein
MKFSTLLFVFLIVVIGFTAIAQNTDDKIKEKPVKEVFTAKQYEDLLAQLKTGGTDINYRTFRMSFAETKNYSYHGVDNDAKNKMLEALGKKKYKDALKKAEEILKDDFTEPNSHYVAFIASKELKNEKKSQFHKTIVNGLLNSIQNGHDGKTAKTAFEVITISEEYFVMQILGFRVGSQSLNNELGHTYDVLNGTNPETKENASFYFNIDVVWAAETKMFGGK